MDDAINRRKEAAKDEARTESVHGGITPPSPEEERKARQDRINISRLRDKVTPQDMPDVLRALRLIEGWEKQDEDVRKAHDPLYIYKNF